MPNYRRLYVPGGEYFFTVNLEERSSNLLVRRIDALHAARRYVEERAPFETVAAVALPDHLHCIWRLPSGDADFRGRWRLLKGHSTRSVAKSDAAAPGRGEGGTWCMATPLLVARDPR